MDDPTMPAGAPMPDEGTPAMPETPATPEAPAEGDEAPAEVDSQAV